MPVSRVRRLAYFSPVQDPQIKELIDKVNDIVDVSIIEQGSNANGKWRKWNDGTLECWGNGSNTLTTSQITGNIYYSPNPPTIIFPASFLIGSVPYIKTFPVDGSTSILWTGTAVNITTTGFVSVLISYANNSTGKIGFYARGRWK